MRIGRLTINDKTMVTEGPVRLDATMASQIIQHAVKAKGEDSHSGPKVTVEDGWPMLDLTEPVPFPEEGSELHQWAESIMANADMLSRMN